MKLILNIAGNVLNVESFDFTLLPGRRFANFIDDSPNPGLPGATIRVHAGSAEVPPGSECLFQAPFIEEIEGMMIERNSEFWSIWKNDDALFIKTTFPLSKSNKKGLLKFSLKSSDWNLWIDPSTATPIDPIEYPLDGLVLYYLSVINKDIMVHASGVNHDGRGYVFSGVSGKGKTTMSGLWRSAGATVIHDDRLILRKTDNGYSMYNTPVYENEVPSISPVDAIFIIDHGRENVTEKFRGAAAISAVMSNCIQHNWGQEIISGLLSAVTDLVSEIPVYKLSFIPDKRIIDHILHG